MVQTRERCRAFLSKITMGLGVRKDILTDQTILADPENIHDKPQRMIKLVFGDLDDISNFVAEKAKQEMVITKPFDKPNKSKPKWNVGMVPVDETDITSDEPAPSGQSKDNDNEHEKQSEVEDDDKNACWFDARKYLLEVQDQQNKKFKHDRTDEKQSEEKTVSLSEKNMEDKTIRQPEKNKEVSNNTCPKKTAETSNIITNLKETRMTRKYATFKFKSDSKSKLKENLKFSSHMKDAIQAVCQICFEPKTTAQMRTHSKVAHQMTITEYKHQHGSLMKHLIEEVYHRCGVCSQPMLLDSDIIAPHAKSHGMMHKDYSARFLTLVLKKRGTKRTKSTRTEIIERLGAKITENAKLEAEKSAEKKTISNKNAAKKLVHKIRKPTSEELLKELEAMVAIN